MLAASFLTTSCGLMVEKPKSIAARGAETPAIIEASLRCALQQHQKEASDLGATLCVGVRDAQGLHDPTEETLKRLGPDHVRALSDCHADTAIALVAGPVEWLEDNEVRVSATYARASRLDRRLAYRVVREETRWYCAGPVLSWDPF